MADPPRQARRAVSTEGARELWRIAPEPLEEAQEDATPLAIRAQEDAGQGETGVHICFGYAAVMQNKPSGSSFLSELRAKPENIILAPDCGMKYLSRESANGKMTSMVQAAKILRARYS